MSARVLTLASMIVAGCCSVDPTDPAVLDAGPADASVVADAGSSVDPCDCAYALKACAVSGYTCGVRVGCAVARRHTADGGVEVVDVNVCPVPLTERGVVVALCLQGGACAVGDGGVVPRAEVE